MADYPYKSGAGGTGTSYSGGTGGGGSYTRGVATMWGANWTKVQGTAGSNDGGIGGTGSGGGAGNPGASSSLAAEDDKGSNGTGGLLILYGASIINNGEIESKGTSGGNTGWGGAGGGSGGGSINLFFRENITKGNITVSGGNAGIGRYSGYGTKKC